MKTIRILVVDDDRLIALPLRRLLEQRGHEVQTATDGEQALRAASTFHPKVIILDVMMPGLNGYRVSRAIKTLAPRAGVHVPKILLLTARRLDDDPERERTFMEFSKADGMMYKPYEPRELLARIDELLGVPAR